MDGATYASARAHLEPSHRTVRLALFGWLKGGLHKRRFINKEGVVDELTALLVSRSVDRIRPRFLKWIRRLKNINETHDDCQSSKKSSSFCERQG
jgi:hypothetical protein